MDIKEIRLHIKIISDPDMGISATLIDKLFALCNRVEQLEAVTEKAIHALQDPLNNRAIVDTIWMPDEQAMTLVDFLCGKSGGK